MGAWSLRWKAFGREKRPHASDVLPKISSADLQDDFWNLTFCNSYIRVVLGLPSWKFIQMQILANTWKQNHWPSTLWSPRIISRGLLPCIKQSRYRVRQPWTYHHSSFSTARSHENYDMAAISDPTAEGATAMFKELEKKFPIQNLGEERWYLIAVCYSKTGAS